MKPQDPFNPTFLPPNPRPQFQSHLPAQQPVGPPDYHRSNGDGQSPYPSYPPVGQHTQPPVSRPLPYQPPPMSQQPSMPSYPSQPIYPSLTSVSQTFPNQQYGVQPPTQSLQSHSQNDRSRFGQSTYEQQSATASAAHGAATGYNGYSNPNYSQQALTNQMNNLSVTNQGFNKLWGTDFINLLEQKNVIPPHGCKPPEIRFHQEYMNSVNCSPEIFRCTLTRIPESKSLLAKSRLPLGILIHPFKDLTVGKQLPVIQCSTIVRCRSCRTYINPYVYFVDSRRWKCNLCARVNDLPDEFQYDPVTKTYGDPSRRPEVKSATIEFLAPADYMVRPPQAAIYLYIFEVSALAIDSGYLQQACDVILENLDQIPGDSRAQIGFITYDSFVHFFSLADNLSQPHEMIVCDIEEIFIPCPDNLLVSIANNRHMIEHMLSQLPQRYKDSSDNGSALGAALSAAQKLLAPVGGRITVFQCTLPNIGPGKLIQRESSKISPKEIKSALNPSTDFYKKLALDCSSQFIAVDIFFLSRGYADIATISCASKFSGGCNYYFPEYHHVENSSSSYLFEQTLQRYLTRKIGFEAVMRVRCSRGLSIHTFHGNFFVRSTDLLSLPNCNPDSGFGMQVSIDENLVESQQVCFQAALLYTSSKGERRIRVHTLCLPVVGNINDVLAGADQECIMGLIAKMAVDKSLDSGIVDAREAFVNAVVDVLTAYRATQNPGPNFSLIAPHSLKLLPLLTHAMLRSPGFRSDIQVGLDSRAFFLNQMKILPLFSLVQLIHPDLYPIHNIFQTPLALDSDEETPDFARVHLCSSQVEAQGVYLLDKPDIILMYVGRSVSREFCSDIFGVDSFNALNPTNTLPELDTVMSKRLRNFITSLQVLKPHSVPLKIIREDGRDRMLFFQNLVEDRGDSSTSYYEFLQQVKGMIH